MHSSSTDAHGKSQSCDAALTVPRFSLNNGKPYGSHDKSESFLLMLVLYVIVNALYPFVFVFEKVQNFFFFLEFEKTWMIIVLGLITTYVYPIPWLTLDETRRFCAFSELVNLMRYMTRNVHVSNESESRTIFMLGILFALLLASVCSIGANLECILVLCMPFIFARAAKISIRSVGRRMTWLALTIVFRLFTLMRKSLSFSKMQKYTEAHPSILYCAQGIFMIAPWCIGIALAFITVLPTPATLAYLRPELPRYILMVGAAAMTFEIAAICVIRASGDPASYEKTLFFTLAAFFSIVNNYMHTVHPVADESVSTASGYTSDTLKEDETSETHSRSQRSSDSPKQDNSDVPFGVPNSKASDTDKELARLIPEYMDAFYAVEEAAERFTVRLFNNLDVLTTDQLRIAMEDFDEMHRAYKRHIDQTSAMLVRHTPQETMFRALYAARGSAVSIFLRMLAWVFMDVFFQRCMKDADPEGYWYSVFNFLDSYLPNLLDVPPVTLPDRRKDRK